VEVSVAFAIPDTEGKGVRLFRCTSQVARRSMRQANRSRSEREAGVPHPPPDRANPKQFIHHGLGRKPRFGSGAGVAECAWIVSRTRGKVAFEMLMMRR